MNRDTIDFVWLNKWSYYAFLVLMTVVGGMGCWQRYEEGIRTSWQVVGFLFGLYLIAVFLLHRYLGLAVRWVEVGTWVNLIQWGWISFLMTGYPTYMESNSSWSLVVGSLMTCLLLAHLVLYPYSRVQDMEEG